MSSICVYVAAFFDGCLSTGPPEPSGRAQRSNGTRGGPLATPPAPLRRIFSLKNTASWGLFFYLCCFVLFLPFCFNELLSFSLFLEILEIHRAEVVVLLYPLRILLFFPNPRNPRQYRTLSKSFVGNQKSSALFLNKTLALTNFTHKEQKTDQPSTHGILYLFDFFQEKKPNPPKNKKNYSLLQKIT